MDGKTSRWPPRRPGDAGKGWGKRPMDEEKFRKNHDGTNWEDEGVVTPEEHVADQELLDWFMSVEHHSRLSNGVYVVTAKVDTTSRTVTDRDFDRAIRRLRAQLG